MDDQNHPIVKAQNLAAIGAQAAETARANLLQELRSKGIDEQALAIIGNDLLNATKQKVQFDIKSGEFKYSRHMADNVTRFNTFKLLLEFLDAMPSKKVDINDNRQTRQLAGMLFKRMEQAGMLGVDDKMVPVVSDQEGELLSDMVQMRQAKGGGFEKSEEVEDE